MESIDREDIDPKSIFNFAIEPPLTKDDILMHIRTVIQGCSASIDNTELGPSWKDTANRLATIKHINKKFYTEVQIWLGVTQTFIIYCEQDKQLIITATVYPWISNLLLVQNHINTLNNIV